MALLIFGLPFLILTASTAIARWKGDKAKPDDAAATRKKFYWGLVAGAGTGIFALCIWGIYKLILKSEYLPQNNLEPKKVWKLVYTPAVEGEKANQLNILPWLLGCIGCYLTTMVSAAAQYEILNQDIMLVTEAAVVAGQVSLMSVIIFVLVFVEHLITTVKGLKWFKVKPPVTADGLADAIATVQAATAELPAEVQAGVKVLIDNINDGADCIAAHGGIDGALAPGYWHDRKECPWHPASQPAQAQAALPSIPPSNATPTSLPPHQSFNVALNTIKAQTGTETAAARKAATATAGAAAGAAANVSNAAKAKAGAAGASINRFMKNAQAPKAPPAALKA